MPIDNPQGTSISTPEIDEDMMDAAREGAGDTSQSDDPSDTSAENDVEGSSPATDGKEPQPEKEEWDPLKVAKKAIEKKPGDQKSDSQESGPDGAAADASSKSGDSQKQAGAKGAEEAEDLSEEEVKALPQKTQKRIKYLLGERQRLTEENSDLKPLAERQRALDDYIQETRMSGDEVTNLLVVGAMAKSGKTEEIQYALTEAKKFVASLENALGEVLPADLQQKVDNGDIDEESAKEISKARANQRLAEVGSQRVQQETEVERTQRQVSDVHQTVAAWQQQKIQTDPDYQLKALYLQDAIAARVAKEPGGRVLDKARALQIAEDAYQSVEARMRSTKATPPEKRVLPRGAKPTQLAAQPKNALDAARQGLQKTRGQ